MATDPADEGMSLKQLAKNISILTVGDCSRHSMLAETIGANLSERPEQRSEL
jgi:hypothetical protein